MNILTKLKVMYKLWQHKKTHQDKLSWFTLRMTPFYRVYKCSACHRHVEVRI